jgi:hypothetical protein
MAVTAANVRALEGAIKRQYLAGGTVAMGQSVYNASDGDVELTDANVAVTSEAIGVIVAVGDAGETTAADGDAVTVCVYGPVGGFSSLTPGAKQYVGETAGAIVETAPTGSATWTKPIGYAESASVLFVNPNIEDASSNS